METPGEKTVVLAYGGERIELTLELEGGKYATTVTLNGVPCHLEAIPAERFVRDYPVDDDPDTRPKTDAAGHCFLLVPFSD